MLHVRDLPVVKIALLLIFSESDYMYFICFILGCGVYFIYHFSGCGTGPQPCKIFDNNHRGWLHCLQYSVQFSLTWSGGVNLPNNGVSLYLQNWVDLNYYIRFAVL